MSRPARIALFAALSLGFTGCDSSALSGDAGAFVIHEYYDGATAWTWREPGAADTGDDVVLDQAQLLHAQRADDGTIEVRRGVTWEDGTAVGSLTFDLLATDLILSTWSWGDSGSGDATILARERGSPGDTVTNLQGSCVVDVVDDLETYYGTFDHALKSTCTGTDASEGDYWFAKGFSLVKAETAAFSLDLVAPH